EQVEGREADARSDIWAFGCLLYEMVSGVRPFQGPTPASVVAAILERAPSPAPRAASLPPRLWEAISTCLQKNPDDRWQSARDLARERARCAAAGAASGVTVPAAEAATPPSMSRRAWLGLVAAAAVSAGAAAAWFAHQAASGAAAPTGPPVIVLMDS